MIQLVKLPVQKGNVPLRIAKGHFVTNHSHINYYIDITFQKTRISEAKASAYQLVSNFINDTPVDTILCLDGTAVLGTCIADELTKSGFRTINAHQTIYVVEPEYNAHSQIIFGDNIHDGSRFLLSFAVQKSVLHCTAHAVIRHAATQPDQEQSHCGQTGGHPFLAFKTTPGQFQITLCHPPGYDQSDRNRTPDPFVIIKPGLSYQKHDSRHRNHQ